MRTACAARPGLPSCRRWNGKRGNMELEWENVRELVGRFEENEELEELELAEGSFSLLLRKRQKGQEAAAQGAQVPAQPEQAAGTAGLAAGTASPAAGNDADGNRVDGAQEVPEGSVMVKAPLVGTFFSAPEPGAQDYVQEGQVVKKGDTIGLIEAMKIMNEVPAPCDGVISRILVKNHDFVAYDAPLFQIREIGNV